MPPAKPGSQNGVNPFRNAVCELVAGERHDHRPVAERQHREHLAPGDLAGCLARARRGEDEVLARVRPSWCTRRRRPGTSPASRRPPCCPSPTRRAGSGPAVMSFSCVPITWLRSTAVWAFASSTIALHVGPLGDAEVLGDAGRAAGPLDVAALDHQLEDGVARPGVDALGDQDVADHQVRDAVGVPDDDGVDRRVLRARPRCRGSGRPTARRRRCRSCCGRRSCPGG